MRTITITAVVGMLVLATPHAATVMVDPSTTYQTVDGFGGFGGYVSEWGHKPQTTAGWADLIANDLGLSIHRYFLNPNDLEPVNDNNDPHDLDLSKFNVDGAIKYQVPLLKELKERGVKKFFFSILTPPHWMKQGPYYAGCYGGGTCDCCGGRLRHDMYDEFAEFCLGYVKITKQLTGIDLYALSLQNEPYFAEPYGSCVYTVTELRDVVKKVGAMFKKNGIKTKIMLPEDVMSAYTRYRGYIETAGRDAEARQYLGIAAVHNYAPNGITYESGSGELWKATHAVAAKYDMPLWMTETSGLKHNWTDAMTLAKGIYGALKFGNLAGWVYYRLGGSDGALTQNGRPTPLFYASKNYYRYIRPGAVRVGCESDDRGIGCVAFVHREQKTISLVLLNVSDGTKTVSLRGGGLPQSMERYMSSTGSNCEKQSPVPGSGAVSLPGNSITTLVGRSYTVPVVAVRKTTAAQSPFGQWIERAVRMYGLDGRVVPRVGERGNANGVILLQGRGVPHLKARLRRSVLTD